MIKIFEIIERKVKVFITLFFSFSMLLFYYCEDGGHYSGSGEAPLFRHLISQKNDVVCEIDGKEISRFEEDVNTNILRVFVTSCNGIFRVHHIRYLNENGEKINFITFKFPLFKSGGIDASIDNTDVVVEETTRFVKIYYDKEPLGGFVVENNPFSKEILFEYRHDLKDLRKLDNVCF